MKSQLSIKFYASLALALLCALFGGGVWALDTSTEEAECADIGFKKKTTAFANCVMELVERRGVTLPEGAQKTADSSDDATCRKYGFKPKSESYAACRQQIDMARQEAQRQQDNYARQKADYEAQLAAKQDERNRRASLALLQAGLGMLSGRNATNSSYSTTAIQPPTPPNMQNRTYLLPGGKTMNCNTNGNVTTCF